MAGINGGPTVVEEWNVSRTVPPSFSRSRQNRVSVYGASASVAEAEENKERLAVMNCEGKMDDVCCD